MKEKHITVFCASSDRIEPRFRDIADCVGRLLAEHNLTLVYGGGDVGLMGILARAVHSHDGHVVGIIPHALRSIEGVAYETADELIITDTMRERKALMYERADAFVALPGGIGTLEEFLEVVTLKRLGYHDRPILLVNPDGFFDNLLAFFADLEEHNFMDAVQPTLFETVSLPEELLQNSSFRSILGG